jgi:four helix bundle protein
VEEFLFEAKMAAVKTFEELYVFQEARRMASDIWKLTGNKASLMDRVLVDQMRRASLSVVSNIAEGFERGSRAEFGRFLKMAKGSCGEIRAQMLVASDLEYISKRQYEEFCLSSRHIGAGLSKLVQYLNDHNERKKPARKVS